MSDPIRFPTRWPEELEQHEENFVTEEREAALAKIESMRARVEEIMSRPDYWRGAANARDDGDPGLMRIYRIESELRAGRTLDRIPDYAAWRSAPR